MRWPFGDLRPLNYQCILADPPWSFELFSDKGSGKSAQAHYSCMSLETLAALPVSHLAGGDCALAMWATAPMMPQAFDLLKVWGFRYITMGTWAKQSSTGDKWAFGPGYVFRTAAEFYILGKIGEPRQVSHSIRNLIVAPVRGHSVKPDTLHEHLEAMWPGPRLELFARRRRAGWDAWGDQLPAKS